MKLGFCFLPVVPVRSTPSDAAEMITQLLFGDTFSIQEELEKWVKIEISFDKYIGWIDRKQFLEISKSEYTEIILWKNHVIKPNVTFFYNNIQFSAPIGSSVPNKTSIILSDKTFSFPQQNIKTPLGIKDTAQLYLGSPYLWGGRSPFGIDCSGFVQQVFKINSISLLRDASQQATQGIVVGFFSDIRENDLLFFNNKENKIIHVGIYIGNSQIIHSSGYVKIDSVDEKGIFNTETNMYTHSLCSIKRMV